MLNEITCLYCEAPLDGTWKFDAPNRVFLCGGCKTSIDTTTLLTQMEDLQSLPMQVY